MDSIVGMQLFIHIVEQGSLAAAARKIGLTPSAVSRKLSDLEEELGVRLFHRSTRKLSLTESGELLYRKAKPIINDVEQIKSELNLLGSTPSGTLRVTAPAAFGRRIIAPLLIDFFKQYPDIHVGLSLSDLYQDVVGEGYDIAIRQWQPTDTNLRASHLADIELITCASPEYLQQHSTPKKIADLKHHNCLIFRTQPGVNHWQFLSASNTIETVSVKGNFYSDDIDALLATALSGQGIIRSTNWLINQYLDDGRLVAVPPDIPTYPKHKGIYALFSEQRLLSPKARVFIDFLKQRLSQQDWNKK